MNQSPTAESNCLTLAIPNFNGGRFLGRTLESLNANGDSVRWWFQDNRSSDGSLEIAHAFKRPCDTIRVETDHGQADALNRAFGSMGGEIIGFINSDDCLYPGTAKRVLEFFRNHPEIDLVYGEVDWMDEDDQITGSHAGHIESLAEILDVYQVWWANRQWVQPEVFFRRSLWEKAGPFDCRYHLAFDFDFWVRCFRNGARVARVPLKLARFRRHSAQKSTQSEVAAEEIRTILEQALKDQLPIPAFLRRKLHAYLDYDRYRLGSNQPSFISMLLQNPAWLILPEVRRRIQTKLRLR